MFAGLRQALGSLFFDRNRCLTLGTACSGSDLVVHAFSDLFRYWIEKCGFVGQPLRHILSVEKERLEDMVFCYTECRGRCLGSLRGGFAACVSEFP